MSNGDFEREVIERLTRLETKIDNGISRRLTILEGWIEKRRVSLPMMVSVAALTGAIVAVINAVARAAGWWQ